VSATRVSFSASKDGLLIEGYCVLAKARESRAWKERARAALAINSFGYASIQYHIKFRALLGRGRNIVVNQYRVVVGIVGITYDGDSRSVANRQFNLFVVQSKSAKSQSDRRSVTLFKNYEIVRQYHPPDPKPDF
jgi:hypothetical protein